MKFLSKQINILSVNIGALVRACDISTKEDVYRAVTNVMRPTVPKKHQIQIDSASGHRLITSKEHPTAVYINDHICYIPAGDITTDHFVIIPNGLPDSVSSISEPNVDENYADFSVDEFENYYAGEFSDKMMLAHNSATFNYPIIHLEFERLIELKNEKGTDETRLRTVDYCVHLNGTMYKRWANNQKITFFSPEEVPDLFAAFYSSDLKRFENLYEQYEQDPTKTKRQMMASDVFQKILTERFETGRTYLLHADHVNSQTPFYDPITTTNLCCEITLPTTPLEKDETVGRIALCSLSALNWGKFTNLGTEKEQKLFALACEMAVRGLDALLTYQEYPRKEAELSTLEYRPLGIGLIGFAHWLAKNNLTWGEPDSLEHVNSMMEAMAFHLTSASIQLAEEFGPCEKRTKYHDGWMPMDDSPIKMKTQQNWDELRERSKKHGIRNATLMALMPSECQSWKNNLNLSDGTTPNFHELLETLGVDFSSIEASGIPTRVNTPKFNIKTQFGNKTVDSVYYNGLAPIYSVAFDDGNSYDFTGNHLIQISYNGDNQWCRVDALKNGDLAVGKHTQIISVLPNSFEHTWDVSVNEVEEYLLPNGVVSHNTSSQLANETNGIEPPRDLITVKGSKEGVLPQLVPEYTKLNHAYQTLWNVSATDYIKTVSVLQRYIDQAMSSNTSYDPSKSDGKLPLSLLAKDLILAYKSGIKTLYYNNTRDTNVDIEDDGCADGACKI